jgi:hypothetical protein
MVGAGIGETSLGASAGWHRSMRIPPLMAPGQNGGGAEVARLVAAALRGAARRVGARDGGDIGQCPAAAFARDTQFESGNVVGRGAGARTLRGSLCSRLRVTNTWENAVTLQLTSIAARRPRPICHWAVLPSGNIGPARADCARPKGQRGLPNGAARRQARR